MIPISSADTPCVCSRRRAHLMGSASPKALPCSDRYAARVESLCRPSEHSVLREEFRVDYSSSARRLRAPRTPGPGVLGADRAVAYRPKHANLSLLGKNERDVTEVYGDWTWSAVCKCWTWHVSFLERDSSAVPRPALDKLTTRTSPRQESFTLSKITLGQSKWWRRSIIQLLDVVFPLFSVGTVEIRTLLASVRFARDFFTNARLHGMYRFGTWENFVFLFVGSRRCINWRHCVNVYVGGRRKNSRSAALVCTSVVYEVWHKNNETFVVVPKPLVISIQRLLNYHIP